MEDDTTLNKMICAKLRQEYFKPIPAFNGEEALQILDKEYVDLIICDIMMPKMDGYVLTKELRDASYKLPILMITAKGQIEDLEKGFQVGTDDYMIKPIRMKEMILRVSALLRMSRLDHQQIVQKKDKVRVDEQIRKCIIMLSEKWWNKSRNYELDLESLEIKSDADLLMQVWANLIDNAIKYSPENSTIYISGKIEGDSLFIIIQDEGEGISKEQQSRIFEKFYQCDESHKKHGSGLGLSILKRILELLEGTVTCISENGEGTIMEVRVPR